MSRQYLFMSCWSSYPQWRRLCSDDDIDKVEVKVRGEVVSNVGENNAVLEHGEDAVHTSLAVCAEDMKIIYKTD